MKNSEKKEKPRLLLFFLMIFLNLLPVGAEALLFRAGAPAEIPILAVLIFALSWANFNAADGWGQLLILSVELVLSVAGANLLSTLLYTKYVSGDLMSYTIGYFMLIAGVILAVIISVVSVIVKAVTDKIEKTV